MSRMGAWLRRPPGLGGALDRRLDRRMAWSHERMQSFARARLADRLARAGHPSGDPEETLASLPLLSRDELAAGPERFLNTRWPRAALRLARSSGSSGRPLSVLRDPASILWEEAFLRRQLRAFGWSPAWPELAIRGGSFWGPQADPWRGGWRVAAARLDDEHTRELLRFGEAQGIRLLRGYPSALLELVRRARALGLEDALRRWPVSLVHLSSETVTEHERALLASAFGAPVAEQYGQTERVLLAQSCRLGGLHLVSDYGWGEIVQGRWVGTPLFGPLDLLRYDTGDEASAAPAPCACSWPLPTIGPIEGRRDAVVRTGDGRRVGRLGPALRSVNGVEQVQVQQQPDGALIVRFQPGRPELGESLEAALRGLLADDGLRIELRPGEAPVRDASGKLRAVISYR